MDEPDTMVDDRTVIVTRVFDAPCERVFAAWTDPDQLAAWFGPAGMSVPRDRVRIDLRVGGRLELTMVAPGGGREMTIGYDIVELEPPRLLVLRSDPMPAMGMPDPTVVRVELHDHGPKTRLTLTDGPLPPHGRDGAEAGWRAALEKLAALPS
jgi:uncharacterized protein YndB with AHSA1/START domain